jgi:hypothetical protein
VSSSTASGASGPSIATSSERNARARADRSSTGPVLWAIERATFGSHAMVGFLQLGWEPFAVDGQLVYFRKQTVAGGS